MIQQYNKYMDENGLVINKALTSATGVGEALIPEVLEQQMTDTIIRLSPELAMVDTKSIAGDRSKFNRLTERPRRGGAQGENSRTFTSNSKSARTGTDLKIVKRIGAITNFVKDASRGYLDTPAFEMQNNLQSHVLDLIYYLKWGNADYADGLEFDGLEKFIATNIKREVAAGIVPTNLRFLDSMIDASNRKGGRLHRRAFLMSPEMLSKVSSLLDNVRLNQGLGAGGLSQVEVNGGWRLNAYRDIPIIETTSNGPIAQMDVADITLSSNTTGGGFSNGTFNVFVAPVTLEGEQAATDAKEIILAGGGAVQTIEIAISTPYADPDGSVNVLAYKVYVNPTNALPNDPATIYVKEVSAFLYDGDGAIIGDTGVTGGDKIIITSITPGADVPAHLTGATGNKPLVATGGIFPESVILWDMDPVQGLGKMPYANTSGSEFNGLVTTEELAKVDDFIQFLVKSYLALDDSFEATSFWHRGLRVA